MARASFCVALRAARLAAGRFPLRIHERGGQHAHARTENELHRRACRQAVGRHRRSDPLRAETLRVAGVHSQRLAQRPAKRRWAAKLCRPASRWRGRDSSLPAGGWVQSLRGEASCGGGDAKRGGAARSGACGEGDRDRRGAASASPSARSRRRSAPAMECRRRSFTTGFTAAARPVWPSSGAPSPITPTRWLGSQCCPTSQPARRVAVYDVVTDDPAECFLADGDRRP